MAQSLVDQRLCRQRTVGHEDPLARCVSFVVIAAVPFGVFSVRLQLVLCRDGHPACKVLLQLSRS